MDAYGFNTGHVLHPSDGSSFSFMVEACAPKYQCKNVSVIVPANDYNYMVPTIYLNAVCCSMYCFLKLRYCIRFCFVCFSQVDIEFDIKSNVTRNATLSIATIEYLDIESYGSPDPLSMDAEGFNTGHVLQLNSDGASFSFLVKVCATGYQIQTVTVTVPANDYDYTVPTIYLNAVSEPLDIDIYVTERDITHRLVSKMDL